MELPIFQITALRKVTPLIVAFALLATACSSSSEPSGDAGDAPPTPELSGATDDPPQTREQPAVAEIDWRDCGSFRCASVDVPLDYAQPDGETISIAVTMAPATGDSRGFLFVNPGGPGGSGVEYARSNVAFSPELKRSFDIIGFDPRGVGDSEPNFECGEPGEQISILNEIEGVADTPAEIALGEQAANLCVESMGEAAGLLGTEFVVRDMNEIRKALRAEQISYLGSSYGSTIGVWYASLFPESVRAMVLDGASNPFDSNDTIEEQVDNTLQSLEPIADALEQSLLACDNADCPIYNDGDPIGYFLSATPKLDLVSDLFAGEPDAGALGVVTALYGENLRPNLWQGLYELQEFDDPSILGQLAEFQIDPAGAASFTAHVNCLDGWALDPIENYEVELAESREVETQVFEQLPLLDPLIPETANLCAFYDGFVPEAAVTSLTGAGVPIVVVGNVSDPVTPFVQSEELVAETLDNGYLIEVDHPAHTVYPRNSCVMQTVDNVFLTGQAPADRLTACS